MSVGESMAGDTSCGSIDNGLQKVEKRAKSQDWFCTHPVVVNNLSDNGNLASMGSRSEEDN